MNQTRDWGCLLTAMVTPFDAENHLDIKALQRVANYLVDDQRNTGIVVSGTTGESPTLSDDEKIAALEATLEAVGDRSAVVFGAGTYDTHHSIQLARRAERAGAHGIMVVNPYYSRPGQAGLYAHFSAIAESTALPLMVYNIQPRSAINLETDTLLRLVAAHANIVAVKEASGNINQISDVIRQAPPHFRVYSGDDGLTLPMLALGAVGLVSVAAHIAGDSLRALIDAFPAQPERARAIHHALAPAIQAAFCAPNPVPSKYLLHRFGLCPDRVRLPLVPLNQDERNLCDKLYAQYQSNKASLEPALA